MAKSKITPGESDTELDQTQNTGAALAARPSADVGAYDESYDASQYDDLSRDTEIPVLGLVQGIGNLGKKFKNQAGNFVLGDVVLGPKVTVIPVAMVKFFAERYRNGVEIKPGVIPQDGPRKIFASAQEAAKNGYVVDFSNRAKNRVEEAGRIGYLVVAPEGDSSGEFMLKLPGTDLRIAVAKCSYQRGSYRRTFRPIFDNAYKLALLNGVPTKGLNVTELFQKAQGWNRLWTLSAEEESNPQNSWYESEATKAAELSAETFNWVTENYGNAKA